MVATETPEIRVSFSAKGDEQRNDGSQALEALLPPSASHTNTSLVTNFLPVNPFKTSFLFLPFPEQGLYAHDFPMLGRSPVRRDLASKPELFVPQLLGRRGGYKPSWSPQP